MDDYLDVFGNQEHVGKNKLATYTKTKKQYYTSWQKDILPQEGSKELDFGNSKNLIILIKYIDVEKIFRRTKVAEKSLKLVKKYNELAIESLNKINISEEKRDLLLIWQTIY